MLKKLPLVTSVSLLALLMQSCGLFQPSEENANTSQSPTPAASPSAKPSPPAFAQPTQSGNVSVGALIPSTDPAQRTQEIKQGRQNPFNVIPVQPIIKISPTVAVPPPVTAKPKPQPKVVIRPQLPTKPPKIAALPPPLPEPTEARGVIVSGIIQVGGTPVAILQAPGERVARQVKVGDKLSNDKVLVKAINLNTSEKMPMPVVILEQYGIEVSRAVGAQPEVASQSGSPSKSSLPPAAPVNPL